MTLSHWELPFTSTARSTEINRYEQYKINRYEQYRAQQESRSEHCQPAHTYRHFFLAWLVHDSISDQGYGPPEVSVLSCSQPQESDTFLQPNKVRIRGRLPKA